MRELFQSVPALVVVVVTILAVIIYVGAQLVWISRTRREGRRLAHESDRLAAAVWHDFRVAGISGGDDRPPDPGRLETR